MRNWQLFFTTAFLIVATLAQDYDNIDYVDTDASEDDVEECEEAWDFLEFLKGNVKEKIETIIKDVMSQPGLLLETTVADTMTEVLAIRDDILERAKKIRTGSQNVTICPKQNIRQEEFLSESRNDIMTILLELIEPDAPTAESLQSIGRQLLALRTSTNAKIAELIMLRESTLSTDSHYIPISGDCECGILEEVLLGMESVIEADKRAQEEEEEEEEEEENVDVESEESPMVVLTKVLMTVDVRIGSLYLDILSQLDEMERKRLSKELFDLKDLSKSINEVLSDLAGESNPVKVQRLIKRDVVRIRNDVDRLLQKCRQNCPTECDSCGADKIDEVLNKLQDYNVSLQTLNENDAKDTIRADLMSYIARTNEEMTKLLTAKVESGQSVLESCDKETLQVINSIKGPLWMLVNITIFGNSDTINEMVFALDFALSEMRGKYCAQDATPIQQEPQETQCDLDEIDIAGNWISEIDTIISESLFKTNEGEASDEERTNAMLGFVELKASMEDRVGQLFQDNLVCNEEVAQIKNVYVDQVSRCLTEMMNPRYRFEDKSRSERVQCIKTLRVNMEERRGELMLREIEKRIKENSISNGVNIEVANHNVTTTTEK